MTDIIIDATHRAHGYRFVDGLFEIGGGILFMVLSIPYLVWSLVPQGSKLARLASNGRDVVLLVGIVLLFVVIWTIKQRSTYPRSGYVEEHRPGGGRFLAAMVISVGLLVFAGVLVAGILLFPGFRVGFLNAASYFPTSLGLIFTLILVVWNVRTGIKRFFVLAGVAALASLGLAVTTHITLVAHQFDWSFFASADPNVPMPVEAEFALQSLLHSVYSGVAVIAAIFGLAMLVSGLIVRRKYIQENPLPQEETK